MIDPSTRILIVDDMALLRMQLVKHLHSLGLHDIVEASDGAKALEAIQNAKPNIELIIADYDMPDSSGMDLLKRLRADSRFQGTPLIMMALESEADALRDALKHGANGYLLKPFSLDILREKLSMLRKKSA